MHDAGHIVVQVAYATTARQAVVRCRCHSAQTGAQRRYDLAAFFFAFSDFSAFFRAFSAASLNLVGAKSPS